MLVHLYLYIVAIHLPIEREKEGDRHVAPVRQSWIICPVLCIYTYEQIHLCINTHAYILTQCMCMLSHKHSFPIVHHLN